MSEDLRPQVRHMRWLFQTYSSFSNNDRYVVLILELGIVFHNRSILLVTALYNSILETLIMPRAQCEME